jgi:hypothetical protein
VKHELVKRLHDRYRLEGIEIPYPIQTVIPKLDMEDAMGAGRR